MQLFIAVIVFCLVTFSHGSVVPVRSDFQSSDIPQSRIIGGNAATLGQFPYVVGLQIILERPVIGTCGAALVAANYVLTAAHCVIIYDTIHMEVHLGTLNLKRDNPDHLVVIVPKENFIPHLEYDPNTVQNDIALLRLPENVDFSDEIQPITLPTRSDANINLEGKFLTATGWGRYSDDLSDLSEYLRYLTVTALNQKICKHYYSATLPSTMCTYTGFEVGPCNSDSGGPLAYTEEKTERNILVGVVSYGGPSCVQAGFPTGYARVSSYLDWIEANSDIKIQP